MRVTKKVEYAVLSLMHLAESSQQCGVNEIADAQNLSPHFVAKTLQALTKAGVLNSKRGQHGGYALARPADAITLLELVQAIEGPIAISECLGDENNCTPHSCRLKPVWERVQGSMTDVFRRITLADMLSGFNNEHGLKRPVVLCDFDGTISKQDVSDTVFTLWLGEKWAEIDREWHKGAISMVELYEKCWSLVDAGEHELNGFIDQVEIDPYFAQFIHACDSSGMPVYLLSDGFDLYIDRIMKRYGLSHLKHYSNHLSFQDDRPVPEFHNSHPECNQCANCKKLVMDAKRESADSVIYIGNGLSDRCAAEHADLVFAKDSLLEYCRQKSIACVPYREFDTIIEYLKERSIL